MVLTLRQLVLTAATLTAGCGYYKSEQHFAEDTLKANTRTAITHYKTVTQFTRDSLAIVDAQKRLHEVAADICTKTPGIDTWYRTEGAQIGFREKNIPVTNEALRQSIAKTLGEAYTPCTTQ